MECHVKSKHIPVCNIMVSLCLCRLIRLLFFPLVECNNYLRGQLFITFLVCSPHHKQYWIWDNLPGDNLWPLLKLESIYKLLAILDISFCAMQFSLLNIILLMINSCFWAQSKLSDFTEMQDTMFYFQLESTWFFC